MLRIFYKNLKYNLIETLTISDVFEIDIKEKVSPSEILTARIS